ncbi:hypothetical protein ABZ807_07255 [Micromonospora sp. NPDC047548]|uniref:hypothetical protein n=1 Tax=Micromonospora sp. NPDC047548 TaxID=3155624 RepID=UPI0033FE2585
MFVLLEPRGPESPAAALQRSRLETDHVRELVIPSPRRTDISQPFQPFLELAVDGSDLATLVRSYLDDDEVMLLPDDPDREHRVNTWRYGAPDGPIDVAAPAHRLPFGAPYRSTTDANEVVALAAADSSPGLVPWEELVVAEAATASPTAEDALPRSFPVWVAPLQ